MPAASIALAAALATAGVPAPSLAERASSVFHGWATPETPGCAVAVAKDSATVFERGYGSADLERTTPIRSDTVFEAGSVSKQFTVAAVLLLERDGRLSLNDDVRKYVPELPDYGESITIDQLIYHTSGLRDWYFINGIAGYPWGTRLETNRNSLGVILRQRRLNHAPGAAFSYTGSGYLLLAQVVERVSGRSLADFTKERIFKPLGMISTQWRTDHRRVVPRRAVPYARVRDDFRIHEPLSDVYGQGGLLTTVRDLVVWNAELESGRLMSGLAQRMEMRGRLADGSMVEFGRGLIVGRYKGRAQIAHGGWTTGYRAWLGRYPEVKLSIAVLCNREDSDPERFGQRLADAYIAGDAEPPSGSLPPMQVASQPSRERWRPSAAELADFAGFYASDEAQARYRAEASDGRLWLVLEGRPEFKLRLSPTYRDEFVFSLDAYGGNARFERDDAGRVAGFEVNTERAKHLRFDRVR